MKRSFAEYPELNLFSSDDENPHVEKVLWDSFPCTNNLENNSIPELNFTIRAAGENSMIDLNKAQLYVKAQIMKKTGTALVATKRGQVTTPANEKCALINNGLHSIFEDCSISFNNTEVLNSNRLHPFSSYFINLLDSSSDQMKSYMSSQIWSKDTAFQFDSNDVTKNTGFKARAKPFGDQACDMIGPILSPIFSQDRYLINDVQVGVKLTLGRPGFFLTSNETKADNSAIEDDYYKLKILEAKIFVPYVQLATKTMDDIETILEKSPVVYPIQYVMNKSFPVNSKIKQQTVGSISKGQLPNKIIAAFIGSDIKIQDITKSPFSFLPHNVSKFELKVDGSNYGKCAFDPDYTKKSYSKTYFDLFDSLNYVGNTGHSAPISKEEYIGGYNIYCYSLNPGCLSNKGAFRKRGDVSIYLEFEENSAAEDLQLIVTCIYDKELKIDEFRNFTKDW